MISWNKIVSITISVLVVFHAQAQTVCYYQLTKAKINGKVLTQGKGGQFICIYDNFCYDCDVNGRGVNNGQLHLQSKGEYIVYFGESYFGEGSYYKFNKSLSNLNIITPEGDIYAYNRVTPSSDIKTCSLIKGNRNSSSSSIVSTPIHSGFSTPIEGGNTSNSNSDNSSRQKTKVRKKCAYCDKGERIQHESVSTFGLDGPRVYCSICGKSWSYGTVHKHYKCNHCDGSGYYEYEY